MTDTKTEFDEAVTQEQAPPSVSLQEVQAMVTIIDLCTKRGSFEGAELTSVGTIRDNLSRVLDFHAQAAEADTANDTSAQVTEES